MSIKEQICAEIERRLSNIVTGLDFTAEIELKGILDFIDSLPEQPVEGLEEEVERVCAEIEEQNPQHRGLKPSGIAKIARHFYELGKNSK